MDNEPFTLGKLDAAQHQIDTAVELYFHDGDSVSAYALTFAAMDVLSNISYKRKVTTMFNDFISHIKPERRKDFINFVRKPQMFFKHADQNPDATIEFFPHSYEMFLLLICNIYSELTESSSINMELFNLWYLTQYPDLVDEPTAFKELLLRGNELTKGIDKRLFFDEIKKKPEAKSIMFLQAAAIGNNKRRKVAD